MRLLPVIILLPGVTTPPTMRRYESHAPRKHQYEIKSPRTEARRLAVESWKASRFG
jgi:hypothetical protein